ncbi:MAG: T9SS type A sorting domain-containing protein [Paludibacter sp.]
MVVQLQSPANDNLTVSLGLLEEHENVNVSVLNLNGSLLYQRTSIDNSTFTIPLNNYANGIYFIKVQTNKETIIRKFNVAK